MMYDNHRLISKRRVIEPHVGVIHGNRQPIFLLIMDTAYLCQQNTLPSPHHLLSFLLLWTPLLPSSLFPRPVSPYTRWRICINLPLLLGRSTMSVGPWRTTSVARGRRNMKKLDWLWRARGAEGGGEGRVEGERGPRRWESDGEGGEWSERSRGLWGKGVEWSRSRLKTPEWLCVWLEIVMGLSGGRLRWLGMAIGRSYYRALGFIMNV